MKTIFSFFIIPAILFFYPISIFGQGANQQHTLPRGAYVACVDVMCADIDQGDYTSLNDMITAAQTYNMTYLAFYGLNNVIDNSPTDNNLEIALRYILSQTRIQLPNIEIGVVSPTSGNFENVGLSNFPYNPTTQQPKLVTNYLRQ
jgi:hypothetical protein